MARYEISTRSLLEAADSFKEVSIRLAEAHERLDAVLAQWQENLHDLRLRLANECVSVEDAAGYAHRISQTLLSVTDIYTGAERQAFSGYGSALQQENLAQTSELPHIRKPSVLLTDGDLIMPDWLTLAVLKHMQSKNEVLEGA